jgi:hypothetical protein
MGGSVNISIGVGRGRNGAQARRGKTGAWAVQRTRHEDCSDLDGRLCFAVLPCVGESFLHNQFELRREGRGGKGGREVRRS